MNNSSVLRWLITHCPVYGLKHGREISACLAATFVALARRKDHLQSAVKRLSVSLDASQLMSNACKLFILPFLNWSCGNGVCICSMWFLEEKKEEVWQGMWEPGNGLLRTRICYVDFGLRKCCIKRSCYPCSLWLAILWWFVTLFEIGPCFRFWVWIALSTGPDLLWYGLEDLLLQLLAGTCALLLTIVLVDVRHQRQPQLNGIRASTVRGEVGWKDGSVITFPRESCRLSKAEGENNSLEHRGLF